MVESDEALWHCDRTGSGWHCGCIYRNMPCCHCGKDIRIPQDSGWPACAHNAEDLETVGSFIRRKGSGRPR